ncbi:MAG: glycosyltransferase family 9 protein, partial [Flavobacteriales bacterium]
KQFLIIQTAFLGDAVLVTSIVEKLHAFHPDAAIDLVVRKGNEGLFGYGENGVDRNRTVDPLGRPTNATNHTHPFLRHVLVWDKRQSKTRALFQLIGELRKTEYDHIINAQRFFATGLMMVLARGKDKIGYDKNPLSFLFTRTVEHGIGDGRHEVDRLNDLIAHITDASRPLPRLYPTVTARADAERLVYQHTEAQGRYVCIAPASVWFTKQWPETKWVELIKTLPSELHVFLIGAPSDGPLCQRIIRAAGRGHDLSEDLSLLASAALMEGATMNYVNDSAPLHIASAMNAPVTVVFCSTVPAFGFGPLRENGRVVETNEKLDCRPCGLHGYKTCPKGHFRCALGIEVHHVIT